MKLTTRIGGKLLIHFFAIGVMAVMTACNESDTDGPSTAMAAQVSRGGSTTSAPQPTSSSSSSSSSSGGSSSVSGLSFNLSVLKFHEGETLSVSVVNSGPSVATLSSFSISGSGYQLASGGNCQDGLKLAASGSTNSCAISVSFNSNESSPGTILAGTLSVKSSAGAISLPLTGVEGTPPPPAAGGKLSVKPTILRYAAYLNIPSSQTVTVFNSGTGNVTLQPLNLGSSDPTLFYPAAYPFLVLRGSQYSVTSSTCYNQQVLAPQAYCMITVQVNVTSIPTVPAGTSNSAAIQIGGNVYIGASAGGFGVVEMLAQFYRPSVMTISSPNTALSTVVDFNDVRVGLPYPASLNVTINNSGAAYATLGPTTLQGEGAGFTIKSTNCSQGMNFAGGTTCSYLIEFIPTAAALGPATGTLSTTWTDVYNKTYPLSIPLQANAISLTNITGANPPPNGNCWQELYYPIHVAIQTASDLEKLEGTTTQVGMQIDLMADITLPDNWTAINAANVIFNGNGYTIKSLHMDPNPVAAPTYGGLFGSFYCSVIYNVNFDTVQISNVIFAGGAAVGLATAGSGVFQINVSDATITGVGVAGAVGNLQASQMDNISVANTVSVNGYGASGLVGIVQGLTGSTGAPSWVGYSSTAAPVECRGGTCGGALSEMNGASSLINVTSTGNVSCIEPSYAGVFIGGDNLGILKSSGGTGSLSGCETLPNAK